MSDSETDIAILNCIEGEYKVLEKYVLLNIIEKKSGHPFSLLYITIGQSDIPSLSPCSKLWEKPFPMLKNWMLLV